MTKDFTNEDSQIDYGKTYEGFYSRYYDVLEQKAKDFFIVNYEDEVTFNTAYNDFEEFLRIDFRKDLFCPKNEKLNELYYLFLKNLPRYKTNTIQKVFKNIIKFKFDEIDVAQLPKDYNFNKFIEEVAFIQSLKEISRLLSINYFYFEMIYNSNRLNVFEIRDYPLAKEDYPYYKEMYAELYYEDRENKNLEVAENEVQDNSKINEVKFNRNHWNEKCFELFNYLLDNYEKEGNIKFINIYYFLKKKISKEFYTFSFTIDQYKTFIEPKYGVKFKTFKKAQFDFDDNVVPILRDFESDFRKQV